MGLIRNLVPDCLHNREVFSIYPRSFTLSFCSPSLSWKSIPSSHAVPPQPVPQFDTQYWKILQHTSSRQNLCSVLFRMLLLPVSIVRKYFHTFQYVMQTLQYVMCQSEPVRFHNPTQQFKSKGKGHPKICH